MSTEAYEPLLLEFKAFVARPPAQRNPLELLNLLRRIFPLASLPVCSPSEPFNPLSFIDPGYNVSWIPKTETTSMAPHNKRRAGKAHQAPRPINVVPAENIATDPPPQVTTQHEYHPQYPVGNTPLSEHGSTAEQPPDATPFFDYSAHHPVLPPISTLLGPAPQVAAMSHPQMAARPSGTYGGAPAPAPAPRYTTAHGGYSGSTATYGRVPPIGHLPRLAPSVSHIRTGSIASSAGYNSSAGYSRPAQLSESVTSGGSSDIILTPGNSNTGQSTSWQSVDANPCSIESSQRSVSEMRPPPPPPASTRGGQVGPTPPPALATSQVPPQAVAPTRAPAMSAPAPSRVSSSGPTPNSDVPEQGDKTGGPPKSQAVPKVTRSGGPAYADEVERARPRKNWRLHEDGFLVDWFCNPNTRAAPERLRQALAPQTYHGSKPCYRRVFLDLAAHPQYFNNSRTVEVIYEHFLKLRETLTDIQRFREYYSIEFHDEADTEELLQRIQRELQEMRTLHGIRLSITAWRLHQYVMQSWYHWMRTTALSTLPATQTTTTRRSGAISPVFSTASAPSALPTQPPVQSHPPTQTPAPLRQAPVPSHPLTRTPAPLHQAPMPSPAPPQPAGSLHANQSPLPSDQDVADAPIPRRPSISSLRVPRDLPAGRLARRNLSGSVYARSAGGSAPTAWTSTQSESSSATGLSHTTDSPAVISEPAGVELVRQGQRQLELREREVAANVNANAAVVHENARVNDLTMSLMQATFKLGEQETTQRIQLDQQRLDLDQQRLDLDQQRLQLEQNRLQLEQHRLQLETHHLALEVERMALQSVASQMSAGAAPRPGITLGPQTNLSQVHNFQSSRPGAPTFNEWLDQARAYYAHSMGYPGLAPAPDSAPYASTSVAVNQAAPHRHTPRAGSSNHPGRLRGFTPPSSSRFEEMGTVAGTPHTEAVGDDSVDVEGMELEYESEAEDDGEQHNA